MNFNSLLRAQDNLRSTVGAHELGSLLWWHLNGTRIDHTRLMATAERHSLDSKYLPAEIKPVQAFRRAWRHATTKLTEGLMLRPIDETTDEIVVGLVREQPDQEHRDLDYEVLTRIVFDKAAETITTDTEHSVLNQVRDLYRHHSAHTTEDIRSMMTAFLADAGVSLRDSGGVYFVPAIHGTALESLCKVVEEVGHNKAYRLPIIDTPTTRVTLREVAERTLDDEVRQLEEELAGFDLEKVRDSTLERRLEAFEQLRSRAGLFAGVLSFKADALNDRIAAMQTGIRRQLGIDPLPTSALTPTAPTTIQPTTASHSFASDVGF